MTVALALQLTENRLADWGAREWIAFYGLLATAIGLGLTVWFTRSSARNTEELLRQELAAKLDIARRPFGDDESYGDGLAIHLGRHAYGCHVQFTGGIRNIGRYPASDIDMVPAIHGAELQMMARPLETQFPHYPPGQFSFMWTVEGIASGATDEQIVMNHVAGHLIRVVVNYMDGNGPAPEPFEQCFTVEWDANRARALQTRRLRGSRCPGSRQVVVGAPQVPTEPSALNGGTGAHEDSR